MTKEKMMGSDDYKEFGEKCGIPIKVANFLMVMVHLILIMNILQL